MYIRTSALVAALLLAGAVTIADAQNAPQGAPPQGGQAGPRQGGSEPARRGEGGPEAGQRRGRTGAPSLEAAMKAMNGALKQLKSSVGDPTRKEECLKQVAMFQYGCAASKAAPMPGDVGKDLDSAGRAKLEEKMRAELRALMATSIQLEDAILAGKADVAAKLVERLTEMRETGHKDMGVDED